jgi:zinc/manganese transport system permease protein
VTGAAADPFRGVAHMVSQPFELRALVAGTFVAAAAGLIGHFLVLRRQVFAADALSHAAFTGALAALAAGVDLRFGLYAGCVAFAVAIGLLARGGRADDVVTGSVFVWILGIGVLLLTLYTNGAASDGSAGVNVLFGSIYGLSRTEVVATVAVTCAVILAVGALARPLLFASVDEAVARSRGVPVAALGTVLLALAGVTAGEATQAVGALLLLGLMASPAAAARRLTTRPYLAMLWSGGLGVLAVWVGLGLSYAWPVLPPSFSILAATSAAYLLATVAGPARRPHQLSWAG